MISPSVPRSLREIPIVPELVLSTDTHTVAIVGAGFSGTVLAVNLLRIPRRRPLRIVLIERTALIGRGVAYSPTAHPYLLNVPASRMSASPEAASEFLDFARSRGIDMGIDDFAPRRLYGEYLWDLLQRAHSQCDSAELRIVRGAVRGLKGGAGAPVELELDGLPAIHAHQVVLCVGSLPAAQICEVELDGSAPAYVPQAYGDAVDFTRAREILLLGTGLTMADIAVAADAQNPNIVVHALSRHGLLPKAQTAAAPVHAKVPDLADLPDKSLRALFKLSRQMARDVERQGGDWRDVVVSLRGIAAEVWAAWSGDDRRRFLRHLRAHWDIHRHRLPPQTMQHLQRLRRENRLHVHAGRLRRLLRDGDGIRAEWISRKDGDERTARFDLVINCTGATAHLDRWDDPLIESLRAGGHISADALGLGLRTASHGAVISAAGQTTPGLYYLGPMLRADHWEATAINELRLHAARLARHLLQEG